MCLLGIIQPDQRFPDIHIRASFNRNPDGFGIMYWNKNEDGTLSSPTIRRGMMNLEEIRNCFQEAEGKFTVFHFRKATLGAKTIENVHPYRVLTSEEDKTNSGGLWMLFNGTLNQLRNKLPGEMSDAAYFASDMMRPLFKAKPNLLKDESFIKLLDDATGTVKTLFIRGNGDYVQINKNLWHTIPEGPVVSNTYSLASKDEIEKEARAARGETEEENNSNELIEFPAQSSAKEDLLPGHPVVEEVIADSPADLAGIKTNDIIYRFNNMVVRNIPQLKNIGLGNLNREIPIDVYRDNQHLSLRITPKMIVAFSKVNKSRVHTAIGIVSGVKQIIPNGAIKSAKESAEVFQEEM